MADQTPVPDDLPPNAIAVVGMAVHAPGASNVEELWQRLVEGQELVEGLRDEELRSAGVPERLIEHPRYVKRALRLVGLADFDPEFFGFTPRDATLLDPQARHLLECAWEALEDAAIDASRPPGPVGLFVGAGASEYLLRNLITQRDLVESMGLEKLLQLGNDRDFLASRIAYALDLRGPCVGVSAACASGALSIHSACQSLIGRECSVALAGAASIAVPHGVGYLYEEGGITSPDGVCRSFDAAAQGTLPSSASAVVALMRLEDAVRDGHSVYAVILATANNNDGRRKVGYAAPSVDGPLGAIEEALAVAGVDGRSIGYVEAHGTATAFGDSIEVSALTKVFRQTGDDVGYCVLGTSKPNLGHPDSASGVLSLIKAALTLKRRTFAPLINFRTPHPLLELESSPFRVTTEATPWQSEGPRRALVNCLAVGGTNVHAVLEEFADAPSDASHSNAELLVLSARSADALEQAQRKLAAHLRAHPELALADVAHTLRLGRRAFDVRKAIVASSREDAIEQLEGRARSASASATDAERERLHELGSAWALGREVDFAVLQNGARRRRVPLPSYPFERRHFWIEPAADEAGLSARQPVHAGALPFARVTYEERARLHAEPERGQRWLVFVDETGLGERALTRLEQAGCEVIAVRFGHGPALLRDGVNAYRIDCDRGFEGPVSLLRELETEGRLPDVILHLWTVTTEERFRSPTNRFHHNVERGYFTLLAIAQGLLSLEVEHTARVVAVTNGALSVAGERVRFAAKGLALGPIGVLPVEDPRIHACAIDIEVPMGAARALMMPSLLMRAHDAVLDLLLPEAIQRGAGVFALRGHHLFERTLSDVQAPPTGGYATPLERSGVYMIVGGFGGVGYALANELAQRVAPRLVLVGRTPLPDRAYWSEWLAAHAERDPVSVRIRMVHELEARGAEVLAVSADVCHLESMRSALILARRRFGPIDGVFHAAGVLDEALTASQSLDQARDAMSPEVLGARVLFELLRHEALDFFAMIGSAARFAPRPGIAARVAAGCFSESFAEQARALKPKLFDLGLVRDRGMYARLANELDAQSYVSDPNARALISQIERGLAPATLARAVIDALGSEHNQLVIGPVPEAAGRVQVAAFSRGDVKRTYVEPEGELERGMAKLWAEALHIDKVGATDNFFDLGGHSMIAVRLGAKIKATWEVNVPLAMLIEAPSVRELSQLLLADISKPTGQTEGTPRTREWSTVVPLHQPQGERPPLFCVGGKGGNVMNLRHLATLLGRDQPVFGLQARGVDGASAPHSTLRGMVDEYIADVRRVRAHGPYFLAGFSGGGALILEMAKLLREQGETVGPLLFLDAWNPATPERNARQKLRAHVGLFEELGPRYMGIALRRVAVKRAQQVLRAHASTIADRIWEPEPHGGAVEDAWDTAAAEYRPSPYAGNAVLFRVRADRTRGELDYADDEQNGWGGIVQGGIEVIDVPGTHTSLVEEPHVRTLAQSVRMVLDRTRRSFATSDRPDASSAGEPGPPWAVTRVQ